VISRNILNVLVMAALFLPPAVLVAWAFARLLEAMGDETGATAVDYVAVAVGGLWAVDLVLLVLSLGIRSLPVDTPADEVREPDELE